MIQNNMMSIMLEEIEKVVKMNSYHLAREIKASNKKRCIKSPLKKKANKMV